MNTPRLDAFRRIVVKVGSSLLVDSKAGKLNEAALLGFAKSFAYEESVAALAAMSGVGIATLDRLISGDRRDPVLIVGKTIGLEWATVRAIIEASPRLPLPGRLAEMQKDFARITEPEAQNALSAWRKSS